MRIKTVAQPPYCPDLASCDFWLFPKLIGCRYEITEEMKETVKKGHWHAHIRGLPWGLQEAVGTIQQVHCNWRRLLRKGLEFHVCTIKKCAHTKKTPETYRMDLVYVFCDFFNLRNKPDIHGTKVAIQFLLLIFFLYYKVKTSIYFLQWYWIIRKALIIFIVPRIQLSKNIVTRSRL